MKKTLKMILALTLALCMFAGCTVVNVAKAGEVNGKDIPLGVYKYVLRIAEMYMGVVDYEDKLSMIAMYDSLASSVAYDAVSDIMAKAGAPEEGKSIWDKEIDGETVGDLVKDSVFTGLAKIYALEDEAFAKEISLTLEESESIKNFKNSLIEMTGSRTAFNEALKEINLTENELSSLWEKAALSSKLSAEFAKENEISDEDLKAYFDENYMRVKHILIMVDGADIPDMEVAKAKADEVLASLNDGASFEELIEEFSGDKDQEGNVNGGDMGYVFKAGDFGNPAFEDASAALNIGEYTKEAVKVEGSYSGYHIIKRYEIPETYFDDNTDSIKDTVKNILSSDTFGIYADELLAAAEVSKKESKIKGIKLTNIK